MDQNKLEILIALLDKKGFNASPFKKNKASIITSAVYDAELSALMAVRNQMGVRMHIKPARSGVRVIFEA